MPDLEERFRSLSTVRTPDLWAEIETREPRSTQRSPRRWPAAVVAFAVAVAGLTFAVSTFRRGGGSTPTGVVTNGRIAFSGLDARTWQIYSIDPDGTALRQLTHLTDQVAEDPVWSPDGDRIAYVEVEDGGGGRSDIWTMNADGSDAARLTEGSGSNWSPTWSPDGTMIAYTHSAPGQADQIWVMASDGSNRHAFTRCGSECLGDSSPAWSPDGHQIAFVRQSGAGAITPYGVFVWPVDEAGNVGLGPEPEIFSSTSWVKELAWSPDGSEIAYTSASDDAAGFGISVMAADGTHARSLTDISSAQAPAWSPDGRQIAFMAPRSGSDHETLYLVDAVGSELSEVPGLPLEATSPT
ncbi:MAG TPA: hypothetical protein VFA25_05700, partial [Actinomycetota bacterium]|nr:hypothetical protein [Actinomycetota bacterium]